MNLVSSLGSSDDDGVDEAERERQSLRWARQTIYAGATVALSEDRSVPGADGIFDHALTNALLLLASHLFGPEHPAKIKGAYLPSAAQLLQELRGHFESVEKPDQVEPHGFLGLIAETDALDVEVFENPHGDAASNAASNAGSAVGEVLWVPTGVNEPVFNEDFRVSPVEREAYIEVRIEQLETAVTRTQKARHGKGKGGVEAADVHALVLLDQAPWLHLLTDQRIDTDWTRSRAADLREATRAWRYLELLDEHEVERRVEEAGYSLGPAPGDADPGPQECPICEHETLSSSGPDHHGYGIVAGTCLVCSYEGTDSVVYEESLKMEWEVRWEHE